VGEVEREEGVARRRTASVDVLEEERAAMHVSDAWARNMRILLVLVEDIQHFYCAHRVRVAQYHSSEHWRGDRGRG
jgi:hypothetical protein